MAGLLGPATWPLSCGGRKARLPAYRSSLLVKFGFETNPCSSLAAETSGDSFRVASSRNSGPKSCSSRSARILLCWLLIRSSDTGSSCLAGGTVSATVPITVAEMSSRQVFICLSAASIEPFRQILTGQPSLQSGLNQFHLLPVQLCQLGVREGHGLGAQCNAFLAAFRVRGNQLGGARVILGGRSQAVRQSGQLLARAEVSAGGLRGSHECKSRPGMGETLG